MAKKGRKTQYKAAFANQARLAISKGGFREVDLCELFGIKTRQTLHDWMKKYPAFKHAIEVGREMLVKKLTDSMLRRAMGYEYEECTFDVTGGKRTLVKVQTKHMAASERLLQFTLANLTRMMQSEFRWMLTSQDAEGGGVTGDVIVNVTKKYEQKGQPDAP
ncbi:MAG TPA: hypothetical protein VMZ31_16835 [Phycisphaerae bacterium]|nr:hypothetical protein [Phycisphaerae bacterium]